jgi:hypothetical protein
VDDVALEPLAQLPPLPDGRGRVLLHTVDAEGAPLLARMWVMADDGEHLFPRYCYRFSIPRVGFHAAPEDCWLDVPSGRVTVGASRGFEYAPAEETVRVAPGETREITLVP